MKIEVAIVSGERVDVVMHSDGSATATLFLGNREITSAVVVPIKGGWLNATEPVFAAIAGLLRHAMATCPIPIRREVIDAEAMLYTNMKGPKT